MSEKNCPTGHLRDVSCVTFTVLGHSSITQLVLTHYMWNKDLDDSLQVNANVTLEYEGHC